VGNSDETVKDNNQTQQVAWFTNGSWLAGMNSSVNVIGTDVTLIE
jgi:hypothetical protein